jgi:hypothetical protein
MRLVLSLLLGASLCSSEVAAQDRSDDKTRVVVLQVKGGGTRALRKSIEALDGTEVKNQSWFLREIEAQELSAKGLLGRQEELQALCGSSRIDYIVDVGAADGVHVVQIIEGAAGEIVRRFEVEQYEPRLSLNSADEIAAVVLTLINTSKAGSKREPAEDKSRPEQRKETPGAVRKSYVNQSSRTRSDDRPAQGNNPKNSMKPKSAIESSQSSSQKNTGTRSSSWRDRLRKKREGETAKQEPPKPRSERRSEPSESAWATKSYEEESRKNRGIMLDATVGLGKRSISWAGRNGAVLNYESKTFPGVSLDLDCYPGEWTSAFPKSVGLHLEVGMGFDSVALQLDQTAAPQTITVHHTGLGLDGLYRLYSSSKTSSMVALFAGARMQRLDVDANPTLPSSNLTSLVVGGKGVYSIDENFSTGFRVGFSPFGVLDDVEVEFGESSSTTSFLAHFFALYRLSPIASVSIGYRLAFAVSSFTGTGTRDFLDTQANDFQHHGSAGIRLEF